MSFVQIIEFRTDDLDGVRKLDEEWQRATAGKRTARRQIVTRDRSQPDRCLAMVFFDSYESAMENSKLPETQAIAAQSSALVDGEPVFHDLEIIADEQL
jgi:quinol monooxygenase YgiN